MEYAIKIHGLIGYDEKEKCFTYSDLLSHLESAKDYDTLLLDIASQGGYIDVMKKIKESLLSSGKILKSINSGMVASCASVLFLLPEKENRTYIPKNGEFLIHNPWTSMSGDANELLAEAIELKQLEEEFIQFYAEKSGKSVDVIREIMLQNEPLSIDSIKNLGFANVEDNRKMAFIGLKQINNNNMDSKFLEKLNEIGSMLTKALEPKRKMILLIDQSGAELEFPDATAEVEITVGSKVLIAGANANGEYILSDGTKIVAVDGVVTEVIAVDNSDELQAKIDELNAQLESLNAEKAQLTETVTAKETENEQMKGQLMTIQKEVEELKKVSTSFMVAPSKTKQQTEIEKKSFTFKRK